MGSGLLPSLSTEAEFDAFVEDEAASERALAGLAAHIGLVGPWERPVRGSALVGLTEGEVVKLMAPHDRAYSTTERVCLAGLDGALPVPTPRLIDAGDFEGWPWIRMSRLEGEELAELWPTLTTGERLSLATQVGELLGALHGLEAPADVERVDWAGWRAERLPTVGAVQRAKGAPEALVGGLDGFMAGADLAQGPVGWLHTEVMLEHLLVTCTDRGPRLSGLFDFEPSWVAPLDYEFASVGLFFSAGDPGILGEVFRAYGRAVSAERLFGLAMLHRYANLGWYHRRLGGPTSVPELAQAWFGSG